MKWCFLCVARLHFVQNLVTSVFQSLWFTLPQASGLDLEKELQKRVCDIMDVVRTVWGGGRVQWACVQCYMYYV